MKHKDIKVTVRKKATEQYFSVVLFILLYKVALAIESVDEILKSNHAFTFLRVSPGDHPLIKIPVDSGMRLLHAVSRCIHIKVTSGVLVGFFERKPLRILFDGHRLSGSIALFPLLKVLELALP